ncbi:MAG TPA: hypothetical protein VIT44_09660, partial [Cyclobacteriaceae bacterium]
MYWKSALLFVTFLFISQVLIAQTVTVTGSALLSGEADHTGIEVEFNQIAPNTSTQIITTDQDGNFSGSIPGGLYNITYKKSDFFSISLRQVNCFSNNDFTSKTLRIRDSQIHVPSDFILVQDAIDDAFEND